MPDLIKTAKEREADTRKLNMGIGTKDIPISARNQRIGFNTKGITKVKSTKRNDPFLRKNFFSDF